MSSANNLPVLVSLSLAAAVFATGCSSIEIKDQQRTTNVQYAGIWQGEFEAVDAMQMSDVATGSGAVFSCHDIPEPLVTASVTDGIISGSLSLDSEIKFVSNVSEDGRFYTEIPRKSTYLVDGRSRFAAREYHVISGVLDPVLSTGSGEYISAFGMPGDGGCKYPIKFVKT